MMSATTNADCSASAAPKALNFFVCLCGIVSGNWSNIIKMDLVQIPSVEKLWRLGVLSPRSGGQNSRPDCRRCRRSARQLSDLELSLLDLFRQFDTADRD